MDAEPKKLKAPGYPNVVHDSEILNENLLSDDRNPVIDWAKEYAQQEIDYLEDRISKNEIQLAELKTNLQYRQTIFYAVCLLTLSMLIAEFVF